MQNLRAAYKQISDDSNGRVSFIDFYSLVNTPLASPDEMQAVFTYDNLHPNARASFLLAQRFVAAFTPENPLSGVDIWNSNRYAGNTNAAGLNQGFINPVLATASGGTAGAGVTLGAGAIAGSLTITGVATGTIAGGNATVAASTIPGGSGNMQSMIITSAADGDGVTVVTASAHAAGGQFLVPGDYAFAQMLCRINAGGIFPKRLYFRLIGFATPTTKTSTLFDDIIPLNDAVAIPELSGVTLLLRTPLIYINSGMGNLTNLQLTFTPVFAGAGNCTINIGNIEIRRIR
jgi:hypothetical protein